VDDDRLLALAAEAAASAYAPYSGLRVGAAALARDGRVFTGVNVENASYGLSLCAERSALAHAVAEGIRPGDVEALAVTAPPCGACRQWLVELAPDRVVYVRPDGSRAVATPAELLPDAFELER
jgi:cytidine deaminase